MERTKMTPQNAVTQPTQTQMIQYLRNSGLELFYIAPKQSSIEAARNTTWQLTDEELQAVESGKGRVGLRLETDRYTMVEIVQPHYCTESLTSIALLPTPAIELWSSEYQCITNLYFSDAPVPNIRVRDNEQEFWSMANGSYDNRLAHSILTGRTARTKLINTPVLSPMHTSCIASKDLEKRLKWAAATEFYSCFTSCGMDVLYLMQYLAVNGVELPTALTMANTIMKRYWPTQIKEAQCRTPYTETQEDTDWQFAHDVLCNRFGDWFVDTLDSWLGFTAPTP